MEDLKNKEREIHRLFEDLYKAWEKGDGHHYASFFTEDSDYITFAGEWLKGRTANAEVHQKLFNGILKRSRLFCEITSIRFLSGDIAIVHATGSIQLRWQKSSVPNRRSINTNVVVKENGNWKITAFHNCRIQKPGLLIKLLLWFKK